MVDIMGIFSRLKRNNVEKAFKKAIVFFNQGNYGKSKEIFLQILDMGYYDVECNDYLSEIYFNLGDLDTALIYLDNSLELVPDNIDSIINKGTILYKLEKYEESLEYFNKALSMDDTNDYARVGKLSVLIEQEKYDEAKNFYKFNCKNTKIGKNQLLKLNNQYQIRHCQLIHCLV